MTPVEIVAGRPSVKLLAYTEEPYALSIATARSCYSPKLVFTDEVKSKPGLGDRIATSIFEAGHHTPFQHPTFVFALENVSRQFVRSFLHSHPYYNSEQSSQRYNVLDAAKVFVPPIEGEALEVYGRAILEAWEAYGRLSEILRSRNVGVMESIGQIKGQTERKVVLETEKKSIEMARYVIPLASFTSLVHTISGIELYRYLRMMKTGDTPFENGQIVPQMIEEVRKADPDLIDKLKIEPMGEADLLENRLQAQIDSNRSERVPAFDLQGFDRQLDGKLSRLIGYAENAEEVVAEAMRQVLGASRDEMSDSAILEYCLNPATNPYLLDTLNSWHHSPLMRGLYHANYTFLKKLSHAADSQDQRHRAVPGSRPLMCLTQTETPDYVTPEVVQASDEALDLYTSTMQNLWDAKNRLVQLGVPVEFALYVLPNAVAIRFTETGNLLGLMHKWRMRSCFLAQREIYRASMDELLQVRDLHPRLTYFIGPACVMRDGLVEPKPLEGPCPEGDRYCGVEVWRRFPKTKRPF